MSHKTCQRAREKRGGCSCRGTIQPGGAAFQPAELQRAMHRLPRPSAAGPHWSPPFRSTKQRLRLCACHQAPFSSSSSTNTCAVSGRRNPSQQPLPGTPPKQGSSHAPTASADYTLAAAATVGSPAAMGGSYMNCGWTSSAAPPLPGGVTIGSSSSSSRSSTPCAPCSHRRLAAAVGHSSALALPLFVGWTPAQPIQRRGAAGAASVTATPRSLSKRPGWPSGCRRPWWCAAARRRPVGRRAACWLRRK